jgi:hypothetical protein
MLESKSVERDALLTSPDLVPIVWTSISTFTAGPPSPFQLCPWPCFVSFYLPPAAAQDLHARVVGARTDYVGCIVFLNKGWMVGMGPVHKTLRDFLVHPEVATRRFMRELEPLLRERFL